MKNPVTSDSFKVGKILEMTLGQEEGVTPKNGYDTRRKYFVVIGQVVNDGIIGVFLINSSINKNHITTKTLRDCQFPLNKKDYPAIDELKNETSFLNCSAITEISKVKINNIGGFEIGQLTEKDLALVINHIETSEVLTPKEKKRFGFEDKS